ncbi:MAG: proline--tRNA ligase [Bacillota bacterium]|nr:proline--tRNA ligase [Bacillota bacterium]
MSQIKQNKNDSITRQEDDFAQWYTDVCKKAQLMDYSSVKGFIDYLPYGYAIWEEIRNYCNRRFKEVGSENVYLPLVIPQSLFATEKEHVEGFAPECLVCTIGGNEKLNDPLIIRPTSEILFSELFRKMVSSYRDLPKVYNQWCSVVRWEKTTRPFLRGAEFLWQEGHCLFETAEQAEENALKVLDIYDDIGKELLAVPFVKGVKTAHERFAGAVNTYSIEALMPDGKALQAGTTHCLGQGFAKAAKIQFLGRDQKLNTPYQTSWGVSTRLIGAMIMAHGDDNGLVLPPYVAPIQAVIVPIRMDKEPRVLEEANRIKAKLESLGVRVKLDDSDKTPGWKFAEWEMKGVPLRIECGPRDLENNTLSLSKRYNGEKSVLSIDELDQVPAILKSIHEGMYQKSLELLNNSITEVHSMEELKAALDKGGYAKLMWNENEELEMKIKELTNGGTARCYPFDAKPFGDTNPLTGEKADKVIYFAKAY